METAILTEGLVKSFGRFRALDEVSLRISRGSVFGLLGPNGAGKTTFVRVLSTLLRPSAGRAEVLGHDVAREPAAVRAQIALTGQFASLDEDLTGRENLIVVARLLGLTRASARIRTEELFAAFDLSEAMNRPVRSYSGGMRRRLDIAASMIARPALLFLDEPTTGLDPRSRAEVWAITRQLARAGTTVLLTTQYLEEADQLAERIAVIDRGRVIAEGSSAELKAKVGSGVLRLELADAAQAAKVEQITTGLGLELRREDDPRRLEVALDEAAATVPLLDALTSAGVVLSGFEFGQPSLDEVFFALTGHPAHEGTSAQQATEHVA